MSLTNWIRTSRRGKLALALGVVLAAVAATTVAVIAEEGDDLTLLAGLCSRL